jgi:hypothetical protein
MTQFNPVRDAVRGIGQSIFFRMTVEHLYQRLRFTEMLLSPVQIRAGEQDKEGR